MKKFFIHDLVSSFTMWFEHILLSEGEAFTNKTVSLTKTNEDSRKSGNLVLGGQFKQWVYDSSISGTNIPTSITDGANTINRGDQGLKIDFNNGRAILNKSSSLTSASINASVKEFNIYRTSKSEEELVLETRYEFNPEFIQDTKPIKSSSILAPCIFVKLESLSKNPYEIGGVGEYTAIMRCIIISNKEFDVDAVGNIFVDKEEKNFLILDSTPLNEFGDIKTPPYNYKNLVQSNFQYSKYAFLSSIDFSKLNGVNNNTLNPDIKVGFLEFEIKLPKIA